MYGNLNPDGRDPFEMKFQLIMHRLMEPDNEPGITRGTLEGILKPGKMTMLRLQGSADSKLAGYVAQGEILNMDPKSFGSIGVFAVPEMGRFYRYGLLKNFFPHHTVIGFDHVGKTVYNAFKLLGVDNIFYNLPKDLHYKGENPF
jgi:L-fucose isomerase-like protein